MSELEKNCSEVTHTQYEEEADGQNVPFPGPLMSEKMQKEDLSRFIRRRCQECALHLDDPDQLKSYFFWKIMERFLNQNRKVMMAEIAMILFQGYSYGRRKLGRVMIQEDWCLPLAHLLSSAAAGDQHRTDIIKMGDDFGNNEMNFLKFTIPTNHIISQEVLERTEVYEYVLSLTSGIGQPHFQPKEVEMMEILCKPPRCKNIVELQEWFDISSCFVLVLERPIPSMDLQKFCENFQDGHLPEDLARVILQQVIRAAQHCFDRGVFHSDLRTQNILINTDTLEVKLIDFGCVEMLCKTSTGCRSFLWSLGWILVEMVCGNSFLYNLDHVIDNCSQMISDDCCHLISQCMIQSEKPLTLDELLNHSWFASGLEDLSHDRELEKNQLRPL
ncbi:serine/threonine-protein kinase pim-2-like isoform X2 [Silurus asotus]|uniref:non-specific serine/threonine protein kinase n=1 Tax=Silurus asotus TaxID=30991 RepID=A0AAD5FI82_SILAS|nr:serine/threonine-protein kinase pim-2-like isoform X2 [Silurus asotus]